MYMDDIMVATIGDLTRHCQIVHKLLDLLEEESFFLKPRKCKFEWTRVEYLGLILDGPNIQIDLIKVQEIAGWPRKIKNLKELRTTLGVLGYHQAFI